MYSDYSFVCISSSSMRATYPCLTESHDDLVTVQKRVLLTIPVSHRITTAREASTCGSVLVNIWNEIAKHSQLDYILKRRVVEFMSVHFIHN
jgi:hypothetical protein